MLVFFFELKFKTRDSEYPSHSIHSEPLSDGTREQNRWNNLYASKPYIEQCPGCEIQVIDIFQLPRDLRCLKTN